MAHGSSAVPLSWQREYEAALLEVDREKLRDRILAAESAIYAKLGSKVGSSDHGEERERLEHALMNLRLLKRLELDSSGDET